MHKSSKQSLKNAGKKLKREKRKVTWCPASGEGGRAVESLQIHSAPGCSSGLVLFPSAKETSRVLWLPLPVRGSAAAWGHCLVPCRLWPRAGLRASVVIFRYRAESALWNPPGVKGLLRSIPRFLNEFCFLFFWGRQGLG